MGEGEKKLENSTWAEELHHRGRRGHIEEILEERARRAVIEEEKKREGGGGIGDRTVTGFKRRGKLEGMVGIDWNFVEVVVER